MITNLLVELVIGIISLATGNIFWQLQKRGKFLRQAINDGLFLSQLITAGALDDSPLVLAPVIDTLRSGYYFPKYSGPDRIGQQDPLTIKVNALLRGSRSICWKLLFRPTVSRC